MKNLLQVAGIVSIFLFGSLAQAKENKATIVAYRPAPSQFVHVYPQLEATDDSIAAAAKANETIEAGQLISLGGFGGYIIAKFDEPVDNKEGAYDFAISGNTFWTNGEVKSAEPGVVWVSRDDNKNGLPDDQWYELAGSEYANSTKGYQITYYRPEREDSVGLDKNGNEKTFYAFSKYIRWRDNQGGEGWIPKNAFHRQSYWFETEPSDSAVFSGTLLPDNATMDGGTVILHNFDWGYVDNYPDDQIDNCSFKIDWAVDADGAAVTLDSIDFIKVHTGINKINPQVGEQSTEVSKIIALRSGHDTKVENVGMSDCFVTGNTLVFARTVGKFKVFNIGGQVVDSGETTQQYEFGHLAPGIYILRGDSGVVKFVRH